MHDFRVEHQAVIAPPLVGDQREGRVLRGRDAREARRQAGDAVAVAHPHGVALARLPHALEERARSADRDLGAAEFAVMAAFDGAAELLGHRHLAIADAEHRHARIEDRLRRARGPLVGHRGRPARQDDRLRLQFGESARRALERRDLAIDPRLAHPPRDQLRHLAAEIDDQQLVVREGGSGGAVGRLGHGGCAPRRDFLCFA